MTTNVQVPSERRKVKSTEIRNALVNGFRMTVVLLKSFRSVSISYITAPLASSTRVVLKGEFFVKMSFKAIVAAPSSNRADVDRSELGREGIVGVLFFQAFWNERGCVGAFIGAALSGAVT